MHLFSSIYWEPTMCQAVFEEHGEHGVHHVHGEHGEQNRIKPLLWGADILVGREKKLNKTNKYYFGRWWLVLQRKMKAEQGNTERDDWEFLWSYFILLTICSLLPLIMSFREVKSLPHRHTAHRLRSRRWKDWGFHPANLSLLCAYQVSRIVEIEGASNFLPWV